MMPYQHVKVKVGSKSRKHFQNKGYPPEKLHRGSTLSVMVHDLPIGSNVLVKYICDVCGCSNEVAYFTIVKKIEHKCRSCTQKGHSPGNKVYFSGKERKNICMLYESKNLPAEEIAKRVGSTQSLILRVLHEEGIVVSRRKKLPNVNCPVCGKQFRLGPSEIKEVNCCSKKCRGIHSRKRVSRSCSQCGKTFKIKPHETHRMFCSLACWYESNKQGFWSLCATCGQEIYSTPARPRQFCSKKCFCVAMDKKVENECTFCGKATRKPPAHLRNDLIFCSQKCSRGYRATNAEYFKSIHKKIGLAHKQKWAKDLAWAGKRRQELASQAIKTMQSSKGHGSAVEKRIHGILDELQADYQRWKCITSKQHRVTKEYDVYFPKTDLYLEVHGTFWHADPRFYDRSQPLYAVQEHNLRNDILKKEIIEK